MTPVSLRIVTSRLAERCLLGLHLTALCVALFLPLWWCFAAIMGLLVHFFWLRRAAAGPNEMRALPDGRLELRWPDGQSRSVDILPSSLITPAVMVLHLHLDSGRTHLVLWPDSAERDVLRMWRIWLCWDLPALKRRLLAMENDQN